jgi:beta-N-acetylhexosaminidase
LLRNKRVIVYAMNAPYYLDATEISKITAYYGLFSKSSKFLEAAAAVLFQELPPAGALPVTVPGVGYNLVDATRPDPSQVIALGLDEPEMTLTPGTTQTLTTGTPEATDVPAYRIGDTIPLRTGIILDHNRNPVPDGTVVTFLFHTGGDTSLAQTTDVTTVNGVARTTYRIDRPGLLDIQVQSDLAQNSTHLRLNITGNEPAAVITIVPTSNPTETPTPTVTPTLTPTVTITPTPVPMPRTGMVDWVLGLAVSLGAGALGLWLGSRISQARWGVRWGLCVAIGGLLAYNYLALNLPGTQDVLKTGVTAGTVLVTLVGAGLGAASGWVWRWIARRQRPDEPVPKT